MGEVFEVVAIAQKRGFIVYQCLTEAIAFLSFAGGWGDRTARELVQPLADLPDYDLIIKYRMGRDEGGDE